MKLNIITEESQKIENYNNVTIQNNQVSLIDISDGECEEVLISNANLLATQSLFAVIKKVGIGGSLKINGVDLNMMCRQTINQMVKDSEVSSIIENSKCIVPVKIIEQILTSNGFDVETTTLQGIQYRICATRK
jgi:hypothetical protein